ncbi:MAG TPA: ubiquinone/menaquinone biosynthesis methyltransferase [Patescibacteria group bacterium]|nr:ubiquinone/menaquinone biosynthesis methyltransferase [Patescibacteria group bacterium]
MQYEVVAEIFSRIARYYDVMNHLFSLNRDCYWRRCAAARTGLRAGDRVLDVCCGTGMFSLELAKLTGKEGRVTGLDFSREMLAVAKGKMERHPLGKTVFLQPGDAMRMEFADGSFPVVVSAFGLRNLPDIENGLREMVRVLESGGRLVILELGKPQGRFWESLYRFYLEVMLPRLGNAAAGSGSPYCWLPESLRRFPTPEVFCRMMTETGLENVERQMLTGGIANVFWGNKRVG